MAPWGRRFFPTLKLCSLIPYEVDQNEVISRSTSARSPSASSALWRAGSPSRRNAPALFVHGQMRLVAEVGLAILLREARVRIARIDLALLERRRLHRRRDDRRVDQRAALDDKTARVELPVDLGKWFFIQSELREPLASPTRAPSCPA